MSLGIRGANPIWAEFNLQGQIFDDTYYLWVLENVLPYIPAAVYHDPNLTTPWTSPIRFYGNGTLPNDIYFESDKVYRLEFRQNDGTVPPSQNDPLIYEVNNYVAGTAGNGPIDTVASTSSNQVTNPQFALVNFSSPYTLSSATNPDPIEIGPGWFLELTGTGNLTMNQVALNSSNANPSNAPYALQLTLSSWDTATVRQRFQQNGMLWATKYVSSTLTAKLTGAPQAVSAVLKDSQGESLGVVLDVPAVDEEWNEFTGYALLPDTTNTDDPPDDAYIDYRLSLPGSIDIYITSIALVVQDLPVEPSFEQDSIQRQIDHTYHDAYPIVPVGTIIDFAGFVVPANFYICDGALKNRINDNLLFQALTKVETVTLTSGLSTFTVASSADYHIGMPIEGTGIPAATTISNKSGTTITMSANATASGSSDVRFFATGAGDGSTTFNVPNAQDYVMAGVGGSLFGTASNGVGTTGGSATHTLTVLEMPALVPVSSLAFSTQSVQTGINTNVPGGAGAWSGGSATAMSLVQQTYLLKKCIRYR